MTILFYSTTFRLFYRGSFSNADLSVVVGGEVNFKGGGGGNLRNAAVTFFIFLAFSFFGMTLTTYHKKDLVESLCTVTCSLYRMDGTKAPVRREATTTYDLRLPTTGSDRGQSQ